MTMCDRLSERMVAVARGESSWTEEEAAHVASCRDCGSEWRVVSAAAAVGARLPELNIARISARVRERLAEPATSIESGLRARGRGRWTNWAIGLAAAAMLVLAVRLTRKPPTPVPPIAVESALVLSELDELSASELEEVLTELDGSGGVPGADGSGLGDLTADELERVLRSWEG